MASEVPSASSDGFGHVLESWRRWWRISVRGTVNQAEVIAKRRTEGEISSRYLLMLCMSAGIAILGLLLSSPAVVIGAMLLSPLMDPIMGLGFALAIGDFHWIKKSAKSLAIGTLIAIIFCALIVFFSPLQTVTSEIAARTKPNLFDLGVAVFSAIAGAYAVIRGREGTIVGVAIATALMPPLAVVGFGLATFNWTVFSGAVGLFFTNLMTIALTATIMARLYGFRTDLSEKQTWFQSVVIAGTFVAIGIPLLLSLLDIADEANDARQINSLVMEPFDSRARLSQVETDFEAEPIRINATVLTPELKDDAEQIAKRAMERALNEPVELVITQYRVGTNAQAAEEAQLSAALAAERADAAEAERLAERLALVAGVGTDDVTVDRERHRATVNARPLEGATLRAYADLERRIVALEEEEWDIRLVPPILSLPDIGFEGEGVSSSGQEAIGLIEWTVKRVNLPIVLEGRANAVALARIALQERGIQAQTAPGREGFSDVSVSWAMPDE